MPAEKVEAIVLHTYNLTESSKIVVLLTPMRGKIRAVAKGVRRTKSKFGSALEPMTHIEAQVHFKEGRDLQTLSQAETRESFAGVRTDLTRLGVASVMCELMEQFVQESEESTRPFVLLLLSLRALASTSKNYGSLLIFYYMKVLEAAGLLPELNHCVDCMKPLQHQVHLDPGSGGALCTKCGVGKGGGVAGTRGREVYDSRIPKISIGSLTIMRRILSTDWAMLERTRVPAASTEEILSALNYYVTYHIGRELRSSKFLRAVSNLK